MSIAPAAPKGTPQSPHPLLINLVRLLARAAAREHGALCCTKCRKEAADA